MLRDAHPEDAPVLCEAEREVVRAFDGLLVSELDEPGERALRDHIDGRFVDDLSMALLLAGTPDGQARSSHPSRGNLAVR